MKLASLNSGLLSELAQYLDTAVIPIGTLCVHGDHLPLGTDVIIPTYLAERINERLGGRILLLPTVTLGCEIHDTGDADRTFSDVRPALLEEYVMHIVRPLHQLGIRHVLVINGNDSLVEPLERACTDLQADGLYVMVKSWWIDYADGLAALVHDLSRAGIAETAVVHAIDAQAVDVSLFPNADMKKADKQLGEQILQKVTELLYNDIVHMWGQA